jgi:hypothetical protein
MRDILFDDLLQIILREEYGDREILLPACRGSAGCGPRPASSLPCCLVGPACLFWSSFMIGICYFARVLMRCNATPHCVTTNSFLPFLQIFIAAEDNGVCTL